MKLYSIETGFFKLDGGAMFGVVPKSMWQKLNPPDDKNLCTWAMRCLLIEDGKRLILVDNGIGNKQDEKFMGHYFLHNTRTIDDALDAIGFHRNDITDVFLTHLHFDHCGGSIERKEDRLVPVFSNAVYWSNERHWQWAVIPNEREKASFLKENILPIQESGQLQFIEVKDEVEFTEHIRVRFFYGHTDAMMLPQINYGNQNIVFMADLLPSVAHLPLPYVMAYDMFPLQTLIEKKKFLDEALQKKYILFFEHDPVHECCTLKSTEKGIRSEEIFRLDTLI
ncbi:MAG TPA: MBL fold metallo-hydrolase [Flavitalea sp.]|nr:MBL fold metallo-hydrolase [Flavitalea sp.]